VPVLDQEPAVPVEKHPAGRAQGERPLMVVLRHLIVFGVLNNLQDPEADPQRGKHDDDGDLKGDESLVDPLAVLTLGHLHACPASP